jgi:4-amino-4-deoxy-L-arabinose transferase-like glycosyltransferase
VTRAVLLGLALRLAFSLGYWNHQPLTRDEREYLSLARGVATGQGFAYDPAVLAGGSDPFGRAPGYPLFLASVGAARAIPSEVPAAAKIAQSVVGALGVWLVWGLSARLTGSRPAAAAAALLAACYPPLVWIAAFALSEAIAWPLGLAVVWLFDRAWQTCRSTQQRWLTVAAGLLAGALVLIRPSTLFFLLLAGAWLLWKRRAGFAVLLAAGALVAIAPWTARNYVHHGRFVLVASEGGVTFWTGNHPRAIGEGDFSANPELKLESQVLRAMHPQLTEEQMEPIYYREAIRWIASHPVDWLMLEARKLFYLVVPVGPSYRVHSARYYLASLISYGLVLPIAVVGFYLLGERRRRSPGLWLLSGSAILMCLVFFPQDRFRIPVIDPVLIICAGAVRGAASAPDAA